MPARKFNLISLAAIAGVFALSAILAPGPLKLIIPVVLIVATFGVAVYKDGMNGVIALWLFFTTPTRLSLKAEAIVAAFVFLFLVAGGCLWFNREELFGSL